MSKKTVRDDIEQMMFHNIYLPTRTIYMGSGSDDADSGESGTDFRMAETIIKTLSILGSQDQDKPITILLNNLGGDVYHGLAIYDAIKLCPSPIIIKAYGYVMSMGAIILQAADERVMAPNAKMMIHSGDTAVIGHVKNVYRWVEEGKKLDRTCELILLDKIREKHLVYKLKDLQKLLDFDTFLSAEEAVNLGLADRILTME